MTVLLIVLCLVLLGVVVFQIGRVTQLTDSIRGEEDAQKSSDYWNSRLIVVFMVAFLGLTGWSAWKYKNFMLGYGPHEAATDHGIALDYLMNFNIVITGIVFVLTHIFLFWFAFKYRDRKANKKATFIAHDNRLELIWTAIPAITMAFLVLQGFTVWNDARADITDDEPVVELEATGMQFAWILRYPGPDGKLGTKNYKRISSNNPLGQIWEDKDNIDDFQASEIVLPKGKKVKVNIAARDVLHSFYIPHFRVKMDAVPGMPTYFVFVPNKTTEEYRQELRKYPEYQEPADPDDPDGPKKWEVFDYELACAELCGKGHFSMRKVVRVVEEDEYNDWLAEQSSYYLGSIRGTDEDPFKDELLDFEIAQRSERFNEDFDSALNATEAADRVIRLEYVYFETGSAHLKALSKYQLNDVAKVLKAHPDLKIELSGHTDNTGNYDNNVTLSNSRAQAVLDYLIQQGVEGVNLSAKGYGPDQPIESNDTEKGRAQNRRTELKLL